MSQDKDIIVDAEFSEGDESGNNSEQNSGGGTPPQDDCSAKKTFDNIGEKIKACWSSFTANCCYCSSSLCGNPRMLINRIESLLEWCRETFPAALFSTISDYCIKSGHIALVAAQLLSLLIGLIAVFTHKSLLYLFYGICMALILVVLQFVAEKFISAGDRLIASSPSSLSSAALPDCTALISEITGITLFVMFLFQAATYKSWAMIWIGIGLLALFDALAYIAMHPSLVNMQTAKDQSAGEEAIGIMAFFAKMLLRLVPLAFGICGVIGTLGMLFATFSLMRSGTLLPVRMSYNLIIFGTVLPLGSYIIFAFYHLLIDVLRSLIGLKHISNNG